MIFFPWLLIWYIIFTYLTVQLALYSWGKSHLVVMYFFFFIAAFNLVTFCWGFFICVYEGYWCVVFFLYTVLFQFCFHKWIGKCFTSVLFGRKLCSLKIWYSFFLKCWVEFTSKTIWVWRFFFGGGKILKYMCNIFNSYIFQGFSDHPHI